MKLGERIKKLRLFRGLKQKELAQAVGITQQSLQSIECGIKVRATKHIDSISKVLNTEPSWLQYGIGKNPFINMANIPEGYIPVLNWKDVLWWAIPGKEHKIIAEDFVASPIPDSPQRNFYSLKIKSDVMVDEQKKFIPGNLLIIDPIVKIKEIQSGDYIIIIMPGEKEPIFRQLIIDGDKLYAKPLNKLYALQELSHEHLLLGKVIEVRNCDLKET